MILHFLALPMYICGSTILPIFTEEGDLSIIASEVHSEVNRTRSRLSIDLSDVSEEGDLCENSPISFITSDGSNICLTQSVQASRSADLVRVRVIPNLASLSNGESENGIMLLPGRWGNDFPAEVKLSMVLSPQVDRYCVSGSVFYVRAYRQADYDKLSFDVESVLMPSEDSMLPPGLYLNVDSFIIDPTPGGNDRLPTRTIRKLRDFFFRGHPDDNIPEILNDCDLINGAYPSIHFRFLKSTGAHHYDPRGIIIYSPDDYLEPIGNNRCRFRVESADNSLPSFGLNFISKIGVHIRNDVTDRYSHKIGFCDPVDPPSGL